MLTLAACVVAVLQTTTAQGTAGIAGQLLDRANRQPVGDAAITVVGTAAILRSNAAGRFTRGGFAPGVYVVQARALGYTPGSWVVELVARETLSVVIELEAVPLTLPGLTVEGAAREQRGMEGFERRRQRARGIYVTEEDITRTNPARLSDILRNAPGVRLVCRFGICRVRMSRANCQPDYFVDGLPANNSTSLEMPVIGVIAVEIYRTSTETPLEFLRGNNTCGTIVIWTRSGL